MTRPSGAWMVRAPIHSVVGATKVPQFMAAKTAVTAMAIHTRIQSMAASWQRQDVRLGCRRLGLPASAAPARPKKARRPDGAGGKVRLGGGGRKTGQPDRNCDQEKAATKEIDKPTTGDDNSR